MSQPSTLESIADEEGYRLLRESAGRFEPDWAVVELSGEDRKGWLQGQQTQDLRDLEAGGSRGFCLCAPTGQLATFGVLWADADRYLVGVPAAGLAALLKRCREMVILEEVVARPLEGHRLVSVQGPEASARLGEVLDLPLLDAGESSLGNASVGCLRHDRTGLGGWDLVVPHSAREVTQLLDEAFEPVSESAVDLARLEAGCPRLGVDTDARTLPPELGPHFEARTTSYRKGCYTGQEVLMRIHSRGHTNRTWRALLCDEAVAPGSPVRSPQRPEAGRVTSAGVSPRFGPIAGAMLRNEAAAEGDEVQIDTPSGLVRAEVRTMPLLG